MSLYDDVEDNIGVFVSVPATTVTATTTPTPTVTTASPNLMKEPNKPQNDIASWSNNSFKLMQAQLQAKRIQQQSVQSNLSRRDHRPATTIAPVIDLSSRSKNDSKIAELSSTQKLMETMTENPAQLELSEGMYNVIEDEYDPLKPNDYEKLVEDLKKRKLYTGPGEELNKSALKGKTQDSNNNNSSYSSRYKGSSNKEATRYGDDHRNGNKTAKSADNNNRNDFFKPRYDDEDYEKDFSATKKTNMGAAFAPPPSLLEESRKSDSEEYESPFQNKNDLMPKSSPATPTGPLTAAEKMMQKMGYKEGEGLGRNKQGMSMALQVEKTGKRSGRIIHEKDVSAKEPTTPVALPPPVAIPSDAMKHQSKNMVGPGEVDGELEGETKEECQKYGEVNKVVIFEVPNTVPEEAVRIFIEFKTIPAAVKALVDLNGRYFGGRVVKATFYNIDKFRSLNLGDEY